MLNVNGNQIINVTVNGSTIDTVNVNSSGVFKRYTEFKFNNNAVANMDILRQSKNVYYTPDGSQEYMAALESWRSNANGDGVIFKDFTFMSITVHSSARVDHVLMIGTCTKSATLPSVILDGTGRTSYSLITIQPDEWKRIEFWGDGSSDIFIGLDSPNIGDYYGAVAIHSSLGAVDAVRAY